MDFPLPPVGEGLLEVELTRWLVRPGDAVAHGQVMAEVMSDKASMELPSPFAGTITSLAAAPGTKVKVGQVILSYDALGESKGNPPEGNGSEITSDPGRGSPRGPTPPGPPSLKGRGENSEVASGASDSESAREALSPVPFREGPGGVGSAPLPPAAPSVRMLARKLGVDLAQVHGTGPHGRILLDDLTPFLAPHANGAAPANGDGRAPAPSKTDTSKLDFGVAGTRQKLIGLRRRIAEHMVESKRHIPHYSYIDECDLTDAVKLRTQLREPLAKAGVKLTYLAFFVKAVARALKEVPIVNSTFDEPAGEVVLHNRYHIGVAVASPGGLMVPVVRDADKKDLATIAADIERLSNDAKAGRSKIEDLRGGTFTVTSVGGIGGLISTPIINHPEVGIMGVGKVVKRPTYDTNGNIKPSDIVYLSFSFDHRIVDGAIGAAFGNAVVRYLQSPAVLLLPEAFGG